MFSFYYAIILLLARYRYLDILFSRLLRVLGVLFIFTFRGFHLWEKPTGFLDPNKLDQLA